MYYSYGLYCTMAPNGVPGTLLPSDAWEQGPRSGYGLPPQHRIARRESHQCDSLVQIVAPAATLRYQNVGPISSPQSKRKAHPLHCIADLFPSRSDPRLTKLANCPPIDATADAMHQGP